MKPSETNKTQVDYFWGNFTVTAPEFSSAAESLKYLEGRSKTYPFFMELMGLYGKHENEVVVDYGCGPGNDLVGYLEYSQAKKVIGIDISPKALELAKKRLALHNYSPERIELILTSDSAETIPLEDASVDFIYCEGVLHHTSYPDKILKEFYRILKPGSESSIMVYNRDSIWYNFYVPYKLMLLDQKYANCSMDDAFRRSTDNEICPISRAYSRKDFSELCAKAGFQVEYKGGYFNLSILEMFKKLKDRALRDERLPEECRKFIEKIQYNDKGYPLYEDKFAGIGGVYLLKKK